LNRMCHPGGHFVAHLERTCLRGDRPGAEPPAPPVPSRPARYCPTQCVWHQHCLSFAGFGAPPARDLTGDFVWQSSCPVVRPLARHRPLASAPRPFASYGSKGRVRRNGNCQAWRFAVLACARLFIYHCVSFGPSKCPKLRFWEYD
jgi:hypothetical protein